MERDGKSAADKEQWEGERGWTLSPDLDSPDSAPRRVREIRDSGPRPRAGCLNLNPDSPPLSFRNFLRLPPPRSPPYFPSLFFPCGKGLGYTRDGAISC